MKIRFEHDKRYLLLHPLMHLLVLWKMIRTKWRKKHGVPDTGSILLFDGLAKTCRMIKEHAASSKAIDLICDFPFTTPKNAGDLLDWLWLKSANCQALRNRRKIVTREILKSCWEIALSQGWREGQLGYSVNQEVRILSLAAGSAKAVIDAVAEAKRRNIKVRCLLVDQSHEALEEARAIAVALGLKDVVEVELQSITIRYLNRTLQRFKPHVVEMVGFIDYLPDKRIVHMSELVHDALPAGGRFLTATIAPYPTREFLKQALNWDMIYRTGDELKRLVCAGGFREEEVWLGAEPWKIFFLLTCFKGTKVKPQEVYIAEEHQSVSFGQKIAGVLQ